MSMTLNKQFYDLAIKRSSETLGELPKELLSYQKSFNNCLPDHSTNSSLEELLFDLPDFGTVLYGDFHSQASVQKKFKYLIELIYVKKTKKLILGLECFHSKDQKWLQQFLDGIIDENQLLEETNFKEAWGFPWDNYRPIINIAKKLNIPIVAINVSSTGQNSLQMRDKHIANVVNRTLIQNPNHLFVCLIGEQHLADQHLPADLNCTSIFRIVSDAEKYCYPKSKVNASCLKLKPNFYCIVDSPLWHKWLSYTLWSEFFFGTCHLKQHFHNPHLTTDIADYFSRISHHVSKQLQIAKPSISSSEHTIKILSPKIRLLQNPSSLVRGSLVNHQFLSRQGYFITRDLQVCWSAFSWNALIKAAIELVYLNYKNLHKNIIARHSQSFILMKSIIANTSFYYIGQNPHTNIDVTEHEAYYLKKILTLVKSKYFKSSSNIEKEKLFLNAIHIDSNNESFLHSQILFISKVISKSIYRNAINREDLKSKISKFIDLDPHSRKKIYRTIWDSIESLDAAEETT